MTGPDDNDKELRDRLAANMIESCELVRWSYVTRIEFAQRRSEWRRVEMLRSAMLSDLEQAQAPYVKLLTGFSPFPQMVRTWFDEESGGLRYEQIAAEDFYAPPGDENPSNK